MIEDKDIRTVYNKDLRKKRGNPRRNSAVQFGEKFRMRAGFTHTNLFKKREK